MQRHSRLGQESVLHVRPNFAPIQQSVEERRGPIKSFPVAPLRGRIRHASSLCQRSPGSDRGGCVQTTLHLPGTNCLLPATYNPPHDIITALLSPAKKHCLHKIALLRKYLPYRLSVYDRSVDKLMWTTPFGSGAFSSEKLITTVCCLIPWRAN
jgi:hypothetical protein